MDEHGSPDDLDSPPGLPILDPREARDRHWRRNGESAGLLFLQALTTQERLWMEQMVTGIARAYGVDRDELLQELHLSLLTCDSIDSGRQSVRAWLRRRARWRAADMLRASPGNRNIRHSIDDIFPEPVSPLSYEPNPDWSIERIRRLGLNRDEAQVVLLVLWGVDVSLRDFSELVERSYSKTRVDKFRGLKKIKDLFDLDPEENAALIAYRKFGTMGPAAHSLGISKTEFRTLAGRARRKIDLVLEKTDGPSADRREEDK
jgi:DNA-directed RNA polymerase specialized sigma24 family protein